VVVPWPFKKEEDYMEYVRKTVNSDAFAGIFDLPASIQGKTVEVIIKPAPDKSGTAGHQQEKSAFGYLNKYADLSKIQQEKEAWGRRAAKKHDNN
jgi:hypothetical protein